MKGLLNDVSKKGSDVRHRRHHRHQPRSVQGFHPVVYLSRNKVCMSYIAKIRTQLAITDHQLPPQVPPADGAPKSRPQEASHTKAPPSPDSTWDLGFPT